MRIALLGYGKMGKMIEAIILRERIHEVNLKATSSNRNEITVATLKKSDVAIDFSAPGIVTENIRLCLEAGIPLVIGTTGWYDQLEKVKALCEEKKGSIVYASNFSIGVNIFFELNRKLAELMKHCEEYEPRITEIHHLQKKDAPSGTAISLAKDILQSTERKTQWVNHESAMSNELVILSEREGAVTGTHRVEYKSAIDRIEITHEAFSREGFAQGAVAAAKWIYKKKGFFEFREIILQLSKP
jgi:4-hydroxy-tetrahydrodipicolinate reductase